MIQTSDFTDYHWLDRRAMRTCKLQTTVKLLWIRGFAQIRSARAALVTLATVWRPQKEKCVYPSQLLQKLHRQHSRNSCDEVLRGHSSGARDVNWSRSRTVDILKPHYANLTVGAVGQSCYPVYQTGFFPMLWVTSFCVWSVLLVRYHFSRQGIYIQSLICLLFTAVWKWPPWALHVGTRLGSFSLLM